jgi:hypothetical protein
MSALNEDLANVKINKVEKFDCLGILSQAIQYFHQNFEKNIGRCR